MGTLLLQSSSLRVCCCCCCCCLSTQVLPGNRDASNSLFICVLVCGYMTTTWFAHTNEMLPRVLVVSNSVIETVTMVATDKFPGSLHLHLC